MVISAKMSRIILINSLIFDLRADPIVLSGIFGGAAVGRRWALLPEPIGSRWAALARGRGRRGVPAHSRRDRRKSTPPSADYVYDIAPDGGCCRGAANLVGPALLPAELRWPVLAQIALPRHAW